MNISKKIVVPLIVLILVAAGGGYYFFTHRHAAPAAGDGHDHAAKGPVQYTCTMHPFIIKDKPGACPICGMTLVKKMEAPPSGSAETDMAGHVTLSPGQMVLANVETVAVGVVPINSEINAVGIVQYDQARQAKVTSWVAGRIDKLYVNRVGDHVSTRQPVALVYSPDLVSAQQEYLLALKSRERFKDSPIGAISQGGEGLAASARQRLKLLGVKDEQIAGLEKAGEPNIRLPIHTPLSGVVIDKIVQEGQYVNAGDPLFNIADLSTVWVELEIYENDFPQVRVGQRVDISTQSYPGKNFNGRVAFVYPFLDPKSRTVKVRVELAKPGLRLKPDMFVNAALKVAMGNFTAVPASAIVDTGKRQVVWVETKPGTFEQRDVTVGARSGDKMQILSGLKSGEKVAVSGGYLIDSEAQLKGGGGHAGHEGMKMEEKPAAPAPKKGGGMDMKDMKM